MSENIFWTATRIPVFVPLSYYTGFPDRLRPYFADGVMYEPYPVNDGFDLANAVCSVPENQPAGIVSGSPVVLPPFVAEFDVSAVLVVSDAGLPTQADRPGFSAGTCSLDGSVVKSRLWLSESYDTDGGTANGFVVAEESVAGTVPVAVVRVVPDGASIDIAAIREEWPSLPHALGEADIGLVYALLLMNFAGGTPAVIFSNYPGIEEIYPPAPDAVIPLEGKSVVFQVLNGTVPTNSVYFGVDFISPDTNYPSVCAYAGGAPTPPKEPGNTTIEGWDTPLAQGRYYTVSQLNALFAAIAEVLDRKVDMRYPEYKGTLLNYQRVINLGEGIAGNHAVTKGQALRAIAGDISADGQPPYGQPENAWVPITITADNVSTAVWQNIISSYNEMEKKLTVDADQPALSPAVGNGEVVRQVADPVDERDAATHGWFRKQLWPS